MDSFVVAVSVTALKATSGHSLLHCAFLSSSPQVSFMEAIGIRYYQNNCIICRYCVSVMLMIIMNIKDLNSCEYVFFIPLFVNA